MVKLEEPDKGQAWVVAIAACIINMILSGLSRMIGLLYVAVIESFGVSRQDATLPFTVRNSIRCLAGPVVGIVGQRYGIRTVTFCGGVVASLGAALCYTAPNVIWLAVFWGGIHGSGFAFANTLFQVVVNQYFQKYRATASGIALSGACIGSLIFPFMIEASLETFGLSGSFLILGGIVMHVLPPSLLLKAPPWVEDPEKYARLKARKMMQESVETFEADMPETPPSEDHVKQWRGIVRTTSLSNCPVEGLDVCSTSRSMKGSNENLAAYFESVANFKGEKRCKRNVICTLYKIYESPPLDRKHSSENGGGAISMNSTFTSPIPTISGDVDAKKPSLKDSTAVEVKTASENKTSLRECIKGIAVLYTNPAYMLISICMTTYVIIFIPILTVIVDYSKDKGIPEADGKYLINSMAMGDLIGRLCFGWVTDKGLISVPVFITLAFIFQGVFISLFPIAGSFYSFMLLLILYGVTAGTILVHFPLLVLKYVNMNLQSVAMGCVGFLSGIISFAIPPMIGHFRDKVGSYDGMFYVTGVISMVSGGFWLLEPLMLKIHNENVNKKLNALNRNDKQFHLENSNEAVSSSNRHKPS